MMKRIMTLKLFILLITSGFCFQSYGMLGLADDVSKTLNLIIDQLENDSELNTNLKRAAQFQITSLISSLRNLLGQACNSKVMNPNFPESIKNLVKELGQGPNNIADSLSLILNKVIADMLDLKNNEAIPEALSKSLGKIVKSVLGDKENPMVKGILVESLEKSLSDLRPELNKVLKESAEEAYKSFRDNLKKDLLIIGGITAGVILTYYIFKKISNEGTLNLNNIKKSNLIVETSCQSFIYRLINFFRKKPSTKILGSNEFTREGKQILKDLEAVINDENIENPRLPQVLFEGPKGNGKVTLAKLMAQSLKIDFIKVDRMSFINFKKGTDAKRALFNLIKDHKKPIMIIIDDAESVLNNPIFQDDLIELLEWAIEQNSKFIIVLCAINKQNIDPKVLNLINRELKFNLPNRLERAKFLKNQASRSQNSSNTLALLSQDKVDELINKTDGYSYAKLRSLIYK